MAILIRKNWRKRFLFLRHQPERKISFSPAGAGEKVFSPAGAGEKEFFFSGTSRRESFFSGAGFFSLLADFLMSIYLKIITEEKNQNQEKKYGLAERKR